MISDDSRDYRKFTDGATCDPEKGIPGLFPEVATAFGALHQCRRGVPNEWNPLQPRAASWCFFESLGYFHGSSLKTVMSNINRS
jgi:hypothetical protein